MKFSHVLAHFSILAVLASCGKNGAPAPVAQETVADEAEWVMAKNTHGIFKTAELVQIKDSKDQKLEFTFYDYDNWDKTVGTKPSTSVDRVVLPNSLGVAGKVYKLTDAKKMFNIQFTCTDKDCSNSKVEFEKINGQFKGKTSITLKTYKDLRPFTFTFQEEKHTHLIDLLDGKKDFNNYNLWDYAHKINEDKALFEVKSNGWILNIVELGTGVKKFKMITTGIDSEDNKGFIVLREKFFTASGILDTSRDAIIHTLTGENVHSFMRGNLVDKKLTNSAIVLFAGNETLKSRSVFYHKGPKVCLSLRLKRERFGMKTLSISNLDNVNDKKEYNSCHIHI